MILSRNATLSELTDLIGNLCERFADNAWLVFQPQFLQLNSEEEYEAKEIKISSGESAFRLSGREVGALAKRGAIGFDWTDLAVLAADGSTTLYLQCIDSSVWHARTNSLELSAVLARNGFTDSGVEKLPFPERKAVLP